MQLCTCSSGTVPGQWMVETLARTDGQSELRGRGEGRKGYAYAYAYAGAGPARAKVHAVLSAESSPAGISPIQLSTLSVAYPRGPRSPAPPGHHHSRACSCVGYASTREYSVASSNKTPSPVYLDAKYIGQTCSSTLLNYGLAHRILLMDTAYLYPS